MPEKPDETIVALSSGQLPSGIAVIRVSGPGVRPLLGELFDSVPEPRRLSLRSIRTRNDELLDEGLVVFFPGPGSATGEDVAEFHVHGSPAVVSAIVEEFANQADFRPAEPGEFTRRAFHNGRLDLTQVEGVADLIASETAAQRRLALNQAGGASRSVLEDWRQRMISARALIEAELDFPDEDDVPGSVSDQVWDDLSALRQEIATQLADRHRGERLRRGFEVVILGPPNAGKSSLINELAKRDVAIVSDEPGTTRDMIEVHLDLHGYPVTVVDTAGMREAVGQVEREGMHRARERAAGSDLVLWLHDSAEDMQTDQALIRADNVLLVATKCDLIESDAERSRILSKVNLMISTKAGDGLDSLVTALGEAAAAGLAGGEQAVITRARHRHALETCIRAMDSAIEASEVPLELRVEDLRRATDQLGRVTGQVDVEDLLDVVFSAFCIGK